MLVFSYESKIGDKVHAKIIRIEDNGSYLDAYTIQRNDNKNLLYCVITINDIVV